MAAENASEIITKETFRKRMYGLLEKLPPNYYITGFIDAREGYERSKKDENELEFIIKYMEKLPAEYSAMIEKEAAKFDSKKSQKESQSEVNYESVIENSPYAVPRNNLSSQPVMSP